MAWEDDDDRPDSFEPLPPAESRAWRHPAEYPAGGTDAPIASWDRIAAAAALSLAAGLPMIATALVHARLRPALGLLAVMVAIGQLASGVAIVRRRLLALASVVPVHVAALATLGAFAVLGDGSVFRPGGIDFVAALLAGTALVVTGSGARDGKRLPGARPAYAWIAALSASLSLVVAVPH